MCPASRYGAGAKSRHLVAFFCPLGGTNHAQVFAVDGRALFVAVRSGLAGPDDDARACTEAQALLDKGAALFDSRNAAAMAATYIEDGSIVVIKRQHNATRGEVELQSFHGRDQIEKGYADIFKERSPEYRSRSTVDFARYLGPHLLLIQGRFAYNRDQGDSIQFVQIRAVSMRNGRS